MPIQRFLSSLTAEVVEILNALSCVAYRETRPIFSPSVGLLGLPAIDSVTPATKLDWEIGVGPKTRALNDTFAGIRPIDVPLFIAAQFAGGIAATLLFRWLVPGLPSAAKDVLVSHPNDD
jgi:hypothetical protein